MVCGCAQVRVDPCIKRSAAWGMGCPFAVCGAFMPIGDRKRNANFATAVPGMLVPRHAL
jgi:hypothetical protein